MERPLKRMRISDPEIRSPRDPGSQLAEGLFTSEMGIRSDDTDKHQPAPSRTINLSELQRRQAIAEHRLARRNAPHNLVPRVPEATATTTVVEINVGDSTATSAATTIPAATAGTVVSLEDLGSLTVPAVSSATNSIGSVLTDSLSLVTSPNTLPSDSASSGNTSLGPAGSGLSDALSNGTITGSSTESTVTVTATSTLEVAYLNGTFVTTTFTGRVASIHSQSSTTSTGGPSGIGGSSDSAESSSATFFGPGSPFATDSTTTSSGSGEASTSSHSDGVGSGLTPTQQTVVGGVVGGVAGVALILLILLAFLRWYRRRLKARGQLPEQIAQRSLGGATHHHTMSQRSSGVPLTSALASSLRKFRPMSSHTQATTATASTMLESEKGFQRIAGRKIAPVLSTGGDGFGGSYGAFEKEVGAPGVSRNIREPSRHTRDERSLAGSSFYLDSNGFYGGRGAITPTLPPSPTTATTGTRSGPGPSTARDFAEDEDLHPSQISLPVSKPEGMAALRPSPARTPVTVSPATSSIKLPIQQTPAMDDAPPMPPMSAGLAVPMSRDGIGRSLASQDGSRVSRTSGKSRFAENM